MKKIFNKVVAAAMRFWLFTFRNKVLERREIGNFRFTFRSYWLYIESVAEKYWSMRFRCDAYPYLFLFHSAKNEKEANLKGFAETMYLTSTILPKDKLFVEDITSALDRYWKRIDEDAARNAKKVTKEQEEIESAFMKDAVERGGMTRKQRKVAERESRKEMKKFLNEMKK